MEKSVNKTSFFLKDLSLKTFVRDDKSLSRWVRLLCDVLCLYTAFVFTYTLLIDMHSSVLSAPVFVYAFVFSCVSIPVILFMKLHTGLLRYSNTQGILRVFASVFIITCAFVMLHYVSSFYFFPIDNQSLFLLMTVNFFIANSFLIMLRVIAKATFNSILNNHKNRMHRSVLIYGSGNDELIIKRALENNNKINYAIKGFIDVKAARKNSSMEQKKVYPISELSSLLKKEKIEELIIVNEDLDQADKKSAIDRCLKLGIRISLVPPVSKWLSDELHKKVIRKLAIEDILHRKPIKIEQSNVEKDLKGKRVLITGAAGSIGSEIVRQVLQFRPSLLILCDQAESPMHEIQLEIAESHPDLNVEVVVSDIRCYEHMHFLFESFYPEYVYHAAAYKHVPLMENNPIEAVCANVEGTKNIADLSVKFDVQKFVMISTDKAVNPTNIMGATKRLAEIYIQSLNRDTKRTRFITTRFGNVLGSNGSVIPRFNKQIEKGGPITVTHPDITRYFMTIAEAVQLVLQAGTMGMGGEIYVFDMGDPVRITDLAKKMVQLAGLELDKDIEIVFTGLRPGEKLFEEVLASAEVSLPTYHEKINIARERNAVTDAKQMIDELLQLNSYANKELVIRRIKEIIPEYKSQNSAYEKYDHVALELHLESV